MSFYDLFGAMFDPDQDPHKRGRRRDEDDPVILDVQTDGDQEGSTSRGPDRGFRFSGPSAPRITRSGRPEGGPSKGTRVLAVVVAIALVVFALLFGLSRFITDVMWYSQLGAGRVIWTQFGVKVGLWVAYALVLVVGIFFGSQFNVDWKQVLLLFNSQSFGVKDPQFGLDTGFYVFVLPGLELVASSVMMILLAALVFSLVTNFLMGGIRLTMPVDGKGILSMTGRARRQVAIWFMLFMLVWGGRTALGVFNRLTEEGDRITGASYTAVKANIPVTLVMAVLIAALGIILGVWILRSKTLAEVRPAADSVAMAVKQWRLPVISIAATIVVAILLTGVWPAVVQRFRVSPNAQEMESEYIQRNIAATTQAYGLTNLKNESYDATTEVQSGALSTPRWFPRPSASCSSPSSTTPSKTPLLLTSMRSTGSARIRSSVPGSWIWRATTIATGSTTIRSSPTVMALWRPTETR